jgi:hypothetical protein
MRLSLFIALEFLLIASPLCAQTLPLTLCIVQTKADPAKQYDPSAGPWAIKIYNQLSGKRLLNGASLRITVLPASVQTDILPEVRRLQCEWVLQLWYLGTPGRPELVGPRQGPRFSNDSLFFSLWNGGHKESALTGSTSLPSKWTLG